MAEYGWHCGNSCRFEAWNSVINVPEMCGKCGTMIASFRRGRWQKQRFLHYPYGMVHETLFLCPDDTERMWKQRQAEYLFCLQKCTNCSSLRNFYILLFRHLLFVGVLWFPFLKLHFPNYSFWYQLSWFLSKYHYYYFFIGTWNYE